MENFTIETYDLSKAREDKNLFLGSNYYKSFFVLKIEGTADLTFSPSGDKIRLGTEINKMTGLKSFNEIYLSNTAQDGKELKIIFGQSLGTDALEAFTQLSQFGVDVNTTVGLKAGDLNLDPDKNEGISLNSETINLINKLDNIITYIDDLENKVDTLQAALDQQLLDNDSIITQLEAINTNTSA